MISTILPLLAFTTFGGIAAGAFVVKAFDSGKAASINGNGPKTAWLFPLVCIALLAVGLLGTLAHLGQPLRFINGLSNPASMISQEAYWAIGFGIVLVADLVIAKVKGNSNVAVRVIGAVAACGLMLVTSIAYAKSLGIPAWNTYITVPFFVLGDVAAGASLCLLFASEKIERTLQLVTVALNGAWLIGLAAYALHLYSIGGSMGTMALAALIGPVACMVIAGCARAGKIPGRTAAIVLIALSFVGIVVTRYAFFAAGL